MCWQYFFLREASWGKLKSILQLVYETPPSTSLSTGSGEVTVQHTCVIDTHTRRACVASSLAKHRLSPTLTWTWYFRVPQRWLTAPCLPLSPSLSLSLFLLFKQRWRRERDLQIWAVQLFIVEFAYFYLLVGWLDGLPTHSFTYFRHSWYNSPLRSVNNS